MALLGLFSKRDKYKSLGSSSSSVPKSSGASAVDSNEEYVVPDTSIIPALPTSVYANPEASSSKFHLGFHRKKANTTPDVPESNLLRPPQQSHTLRSRLEAHTDDIRPPPSKASLFHAYGDPQNALSTRSLPADARTPKQMGSVELPPRRSSDGLRTIADITPVPKKPGGLFSWAHRERKKSKTGEAAPELSLDVSSDSSFNLKSFRHIRPESPSPESVLSSPVLVPPVRPRPRNSSTASDTSQRISVAAFREMAARRSAAGSPTSSPILLRPPSRSDSLEHSPFRSPQSSFQRSPVAGGVAARSSSLAISSGSTSSESEDSAESESEDESPKRPRRQRTITQKSAGKATSEMGHHMRVPEAPPARSAQSALGHSEGPSESAQASQLPKVGDSGGFFRARASVSTSAMQPNAAAKQATHLASTKPALPLSDRAREKARARDSDSDDSSSSSSEDSDDAPLATLVRPARPGSSASNTTSGSRSRIPPKPLIDITQLTTPPLPPLPAPGDQPAKPVSPKREKESLPTPPEEERHSQNLEKTGPEANSGPSSTSTLEKPSVNERLARIAQTAAGKSVEKLADAGPLERRSLDSQPLLSEDMPLRGRLPHPTRSQTAPMDSLDHPTTPSPTSSPTTRPQKPRAFSSSSPNPAAAYDLTDPTPIVPTPIRQRSPPPAFSVTSRPPSQLSLNRLSMSQLTVRMVEPSSASSSPTSPNTPWTSSGDEPPLTTAHLQQQAQIQPPHGHFSASNPSGQSGLPSPSIASVQPSPRAASVQPSPRAASVQPSSKVSFVQPVPRAPSVQPSSRTPSVQPSPRASSVQPSPRNAHMPVYHIPLKESPPLPAPSSTPSNRPSPTPRQRASTLVPPSVLSNSEGFTGGGLLASATSPSPKSGGDKGTGSYAALRTARQRSSTLLPQMEIAPAPTHRKFTDHESVYTSSSGSSGAKPPSSNTSSSQSQVQTAPHAQAQSQGHRFPQRSRLPFEYDSPPSNSHTRSVPSPSSNVPPPKPFAVSERGNSPSSSTGDSSSGRTPLTPADGSDYGYPETKSVVSAMAGTRKGHRQRASVSFEEEPEKDKSKPANKPVSSEEERRKERRRSEAKAAIELGNVVNGRISLEDEDDDELGPLNTMGPRMSMVNPMMSFTPASPQVGWQQQANPAMLGAQQYMMQQNDPRFLVAHQHAMMVAKQAYQMAVAQQALAAANEEWERGSTTSALSSMSLGMQGMNPMGGMGMPGMGMGMGGMGAPMGGMLPGGYGMQWTNPGSMMFPSSASMYAGSVVGGDMGGGGGWGSQSEYGGPSRGNRSSAVMFGSRPVPMMNSARSEIGGPSSAGLRVPNQRPRTKTSPSDAPLPPQHARSRQPPPPSSWRGGRPG